MVLKRTGWFLILVVIMSACAPAVPPAPPPTEPLSAASLLAELSALPGAEASAEPLSLVYPGEVLFAEGAVLPLPGGTELLDPLAAFLASRPELGWRVTVRAATSLGKGYDLRLAQKRAELLARFLANKGIAGERIAWEPIAESGPPLVLELQSEEAAKPASSAAEKE